MPRKYIDTDIINKQIEHTLNENKNENQIYISFIYCHKNA